MTSTKSSSAPSPSDGRLFSPTYERNGPPIIAALAPFLGTKTGTILEIGSGSGQHAGALQLAFPKLTWQPSDIDPRNRASTAAWLTHLRLAERTVFNLDAATDWAGSGRLSALGPLDAVVSMNVIHIAPIEVALGIITGAAKSFG